MMKKLFYILMIVGFFGCDEDDVIKPPFNEFTFNTEFEVKSETSPSYTIAHSYNVRAVQFGRSSGSHEYGYLLETIANGVIPDGGALSISPSDSNDDIMVITGYGTINRSGQIVPEGYNGNPEAWSASIDYSIMIAFNHVTNQVTASTMKLKNDKFNRSYNLKGTFTVDENIYNNIPRIDIYQAKDFAIEELKKVRISVAFDIKP